MAQIKINVAYGATGTLATANIADDAITAAKIADNAVVTAAINADAVTDAKIADDVIGTEHLTAGEVDATALGADSVTAAKIGDNVLNSEHYAAASIDNEHLADDAVDSDELAAGAVDTAHIADDQVTLAKMAGLARGKLIYGDSSGNPAALAVGSANEVLTHDGTDFDWAAAAGGGKVLQIQHSTDNTHISQGSASEYSEITTAITPAATSSKIIVMVTLGFVSGSTTLDLGWVVKRDSTDLQLGTGGSGTYSNCTFGGSMNLATGVAVSSTGILVDSPSSTSEIEYKVFLMPNSNSMVINKRGSNLACATSSTMTLIEIGA